MFEQASRLKLRFPSPIGLLTAEDLWGLPLTSNTGKANLDDIARHLYGKVKADSEVSFVNTPAKVDPADALAFEIVKHVIAVLKAEREAAALAKANAEKKQKLLAILDRKQDEALQSMSAEELRAAISAL